MFFHCKAIVPRKLFAVRTNEQIDSKHLMKHTFPACALVFPALSPSRMGGESADAKTLAFRGRFNEMPPDYHQRRGPKPRITRHETLSAARHKLNPAAVASTSTSLGFRTQPDTSKVNRFDHGYERGKSSCLERIDLSQASHVYSGPNNRADSTKLVLEFLLHLA